jgi:adenosylcobinamide kinase/adenosylcobinamide-phosphate guanylyltransferase
MASPRLTLITGGARSGKSAHALALARSCRGSRRFFIATAEGLDDEMRARIARHQRDRGGLFETLEEPIAISGAIASLGTQADVVVLDCLTLWVSNLMGRGDNEEAVLSHAEKLAEVLARRRCETIIVTDEVGWGIVPENPVARRFRDVLGWTNQKIAQAADRVILMAAGLPVTLKE